MLRAEELKAYAASIGIPACGVCDVGRDEALLSRLMEQRAQHGTCPFEEEDLALRTEPRRLMQEAESIFVCLFPYYRRELPKENISRYAMVPDYHRVVGEYLEKLTAFIKEQEPMAKVKPLCDTSPLSDRRLAYRAGLGFYGKNHMLIHPSYGSYFFIGSLLLSLPLEVDKPMENQCDGCDACLRACPGGALSQNFGYDHQKCISYLTQAKEISEAQQALLGQQESVYGCDICQEVCPHNQNVPDTPIKEFYGSAITHLAEEELSGLSGRAFRKRYADFAFSWCKKQTILKNFKRKKPR